MFRQMLFAKIVPAIKKMGLLSDRQRARFAELGILQFENWADPFDATWRRAARRHVGAAVSRAIVSAWSARAPDRCPRRRVRRLRSKGREGGPEASGQRRLTDRAPSTRTAFAASRSTATQEGYTPDKIAGKPGEKLMLVFTRTVDASCIAQLEDARRQAGRSADEQAGRGRGHRAADRQVGFACGMDMFHGTVVADRSRSTSLHAHRRRRSTRRPRCRCNTYGLYFHVFS